MLITRRLGAEIQRIAKVMPVITITGPRQSGKTTLVRQVFPTYTYTNLENPETRQFAAENPKLFLQQNEKGIIIDEAQYLPELFSYIMLHVDETRRNGEIILTGSQNFLLFEKITQSLAGRVAILHLLPFSYEELSETPYASEDLLKYMFQGMFPRIYDQQVPPDVLYPSYIQSYIERDVRQVQAIGDLMVFEKFLRLCTGRIGQLFNQSNLANEIGVSVPTIRRWMSVLQTGFVTFLLPPYYRNFNKRVLKTPKLYFYDTGLACSLLGIRSSDQLQQHFAFGALFENFIIVELMKRRMHQNIQPDFYYWKDNTGNEIDLLVPKGNEFYALEMKSATRISTEFSRNLEYFQKLTKSGKNLSYLIYAGNETQERSHVKVRSWKKLPDLS
jgi:predicted AAA+ superfamily ATPase